MEPLGDVAARVVDRVSRKRLSTRERVRCFDDAGGICHICDTKIQAGQRWEVSHPIPLAAGGEDTPENRRPAHYKCHRTVTAEVDAPTIAKVKRIRAKHVGAAKSAMPGSRNSRWKKKLNGTVERRTS